MYGKLNLQQIQYWNEKNGGQVQISIEIIKKS